MEHYCAICGKPADHYMKSVDEWYCEKHYWIVAWDLVYNFDVAQKVKKKLKSILTEEEYKNLPKKAFNSTPQKKTWKFLPIIQKMMREFGYKGNVHEDLIHGDDVPKCNICGSKHISGTYIFFDDEHHIFLSVGRKKMDLLFAYDTMDKTKDFLRRQAEYLNGGKYGKVGKGLVFGNE